MIICEETNPNEFDYNPFFKIRELEKNYKFVENLEKINYLFQEFDTTYKEPSYPFWFQEDEEFFLGKSIFNIKNESVSTLENLNMEHSPLLITNNQESMLSIPISNIPRMKQKISDVIKNTKRISDVHYTPSEPHVQFIRHEKEEISNQEKFMFQVMKCCEVGNENDPEEGGSEVITPNVGSKKRREFYYNVNFDKIGKYF